MKTCLISGAQGFIGSHLLQSLASKYRVFAIVKSVDDIPNTPQPDGIIWIGADLSSQDFTLDFPSKIDAVIHLAQSSHYRNFPDYSEDIFSINTRATMLLLEYARKAKASSFIFASSVVGECNNQCVFFEREIEDKHPPLSFYHASKKCAELLAENYSPFFSVVILRFFFVYGPGQGKGMLIPRLITSVLEDKPIFLEGPNGVLINPIYVSDAVNAIEHALKLRKSHKINISGSEDLSLKEICETIGKKTKKTPIFDKISEQTTSLLSDNQKMVELLCSPKTTIETGIESYINATYEVLTH